ncbi:MAG TPA: hypothetical protein VF648_03095 [Pyrinomonadaceae bacterium]|jgi:hypothetical protein
MQQKLKVAFDNPDSGWVGLSLNYGIKTISIIASYTPSDSFLDLTNALHNLLLHNGQATVTWHCEPSEFDMYFSRTTAEISLEISEFFDYHRGEGLGKQIFVVSGTYEDVCLPFWRALRDLQGRFSTEELNARWHRPFPSREIDLLTSEIRAVAK